MSIYTRIASKFPNLKRDLWVAKIRDKPEEYIQKTVKNTLFAGVSLTVLVFFMVDKMNLSLIVIPIAFMIISLIIFTVLFKTAQTQILKRQKMIDQEVLFAGRFLLVKLNSGTPLINALTDASRSYGVANDYFKEIIRDIDTGTPLEEALEKAAKYSPSKRMRKILFQINNALKIGIDVTKSLEATLDQIASEQLIEIERYGKKLGSVTMFYMLLAVVMPSLGLTMFVVVASMVSISADLLLFMGLAILLMIINFVFISVFKSIRPNVNI
jgi:archaeal flagellar protein FlaJ